MPMPAHRASVDPSIVPRNVPYGEVSVVKRSQIAVLAVLVGALAMGAAHAASDPGNGSGLRLPRFVSLKSDKVNVRGGPNKDQNVTWVYTRTGLPVEITAEFENWRRIRDWEGAEGWVYHSLLSSGAGRG